MRRRAMWCVNAARIRVIITAGRGIAIRIITMADIEAATDMGMVMATRTKRGKDSNSYMEAEGPPPIAFL